MRSKLSKSRGVLPARRCPTRTRIDFNPNPMTDELRGWLKQLQCDRCLMDKAIQRRAGVLVLVQEPPGEENLQVLSFCYECGAHVFKNAP